MNKRTNEETNGRTDGWMNETNWSVNFRILQLYAIIVAVYRS